MIKRAFMFSAIFVVGFSILAYAQDATTTYDGQTGFSIQNGNDNPTLSDKQDGVLPSGDIICSTDGDIAITSIDPPLGTVLSIGQSYTFTLGVGYKFNKAAKGWVGILAFDTLSFWNLDNQIQHSSIVSSKRGKTNVSVTTDISLNANPVNIVAVRAALFPEGNGCTTISDQYYYITSNGSGISALNLGGSFVRGKDDIGGFFGEELNGERHTGIDIKATVDALVYPVCDGVVVLNNTARNYGSKYKNYWNSFLVIKHNCDGMTVYGYYGHITSGLKVNENVTAERIGQLPPTPIGSIRASYNKKNVMTPANDHLHFGFNTEYLLGGWGYAPLQESYSDLLQQGWIDPEKFFTW